MEELKKYIKIWIREKWGQKSTLTSKVTCRSYKKYYKDLYRTIKTYKKLYRTIEELKKYVKI